MRVIIVRKRVIFISLLIFTLLLIGGLLHNYRQREITTINPIYIGNTGEKAVALMVNVDWGEDLLPEMIGIFKEKQVKATFFITGHFAKKNPELISLIATSDHQIGNHGFSHPHPDKLSVEQNKKEIIDTQEVFEALKIPFAKVFASPYGEHGKTVLQAANELGYQLIMWTLDTIDWQDPTPKTILGRILPRADSGSLILMHPKECTIQALPELINSLQGAGFTFKKVTEIIKAGESQAEQVNPEE